jgi:hypothetical protein
MFLLLCISTLSFSLLNFLPLAIRLRKKDAISNYEEKSRVRPSTSNDIDDAETSVNNHKIEFEDSPSDSSINSTSSLVKYESNFVRNRGHFFLMNDKTEQITLLTIIFLLSFVCYGVLPGLQSYSTLPYGKQRLFKQIENFYLDFKLIFLGSKETIYLTIRSI